MRTVLAGVLLSMLAAAGCSSSEAESQAVVGYDFGKIDKIAIVEVTGRVYGEAAKNQISNLFAMKLMEKGYTFIERKDIKALLKEQEFQASDLATERRCGQGRPDSQCARRHDDRHPQVQRAARWTCRPS